MKRIFLPFLSILLLLTCTLSACTPKPDGDMSATDQAETPTVSAEQTTEPESETETESQEPGSTDAHTVDIRPKPMEIAYAEGGTVKKAVSLDSTTAKYADLLTKAGFLISQDGLPLRVTLRDLHADFAFGAEEAYVLTVTEQGITVQAQTEQGAYYAIITLLQLAQDRDTVPTVTIKDAPRNVLRGVIEGFYGTAWTHEYRKDLFAFMGQNKMNAYIYAPKDDAKHRAQWRVLYTGQELARMTDLIGAAQANHVRFIYAISPGGVYTDMVKVTRPDLTPEGMIMPEDIADIVEFFLLHRSNAVVDEILVHRVGKAPFQV